MGVSGYHRLVRQSQLVGQGRVTDAMDRSRYLIVVLSHARRDLSGSTGRSATGCSTEDRTSC